MNIFQAGSTAAVTFAAKDLRQIGWDIRQMPESDTQLLLLDVPSFGTNRRLRDGREIEAILQKLPRDVTVCGGNLDHPALDGYSKIDLLKDEWYLAENAYITAEAALDVALPYLKRTIRGCRILILGWGRIGKCLARLLKHMDAVVTVAARKASDRAMIRALGFDTVDFPISYEVLHAAELIYNTIPCPVLDAPQIDTCIRIDLASHQGIAGDDVIIARGLPGIHFPESSGKLIAKTLMGILRKEESS